MIEQTTREGENKNCQKMSVSTLPLSFVTYSGTRKLVSKLMLRRMGTRPAARLAALDRYLNNMDSFEEAKRKLAAKYGTYSGGISSEIN